MQYDLKEIGSYLAILGENYKSDVLPYYVAERLTTGIFEIFKIDTLNDIAFESQYQILVHLPLEGAPILSGIDMLPPLDTQRKELLESMAMRFRHDFYLLDDEHKNSIIIQMGQILEEVIGEGFYKGDAYKYTESMAKNIWKAGQDYIKKSGDSITFEELTETMLRKSRLPIAFEAKTERMVKMVKKEGSWVPSPPFITPLVRKNESGIIQWIGDYIYSV